MKKIILYISLFISIFILTIPISNLNRIPDGIEFRHGVSQYLKNKGVHIDSLNEKLDTIYFYGLSKHALIDKDKTYNPRSTGPIILYSIYGGISGDNSNFGLILTTIIITLCLSVSLILSQKYNNKNYLIITTLTGGISIYTIYGGLLFDTAITYVQIFVGHYLLTNNKKCVNKKLIGHFLLISAAWFRYEFIVFYFIHGVIFGRKNNILKYLIGLGLSIIIIMGVQSFYRGELALTKDKIWDLRSIFEQDSLEEKFNQQQKEYLEKYDDYIAEEFIIKEKIKKEENILETVERVLLSGQSIFSGRIYHLQHLLFGLGFISLCIYFGWLSLLKKGNQDMVFFLVLALIIYILLIYGASTQYYGYKKDVPHSSFIRYSIGLILLVGALGGIYIKNKGMKMILILIFLVSLFPYINYIKYSFPIFTLQERYKNSAYIFLQRNNVENDRSIWISDWAADEAKSMFYENQNQFFYELITKDLRELEIYKIIIEGQKNNYEIFYGKIGKIPDDFKPILEKYFKTIVKINGFSFARAKQFNTYEK